MSSQRGSGTVTEIGGIAEKIRPWESVGEGGFLSGGVTGQEGVSKGTWFSLHHAEKLGQGRRPSWFWGFVGHGSDALFKTTLRGATQREGKNTSLATCLEQPRGKT